MGKPVLSLDFDGCVHSYVSGWQGADNIPDPPVEGAIRFILEALEHFEVHVFSSRSHQEGGIAAMKEYLQLHMINDARLSRGQAMDIVINELQWPIHKPPAHISIDDRAFTFDGDWMKFRVRFQEMLAFKPWNHHLRHPPG